MFSSAFLLGLVLSASAQAWKAPEIVVPTGRDLTLVGEEIAAQKAQDIVAAANSIDPVADFEKYEALVEGVTRVLEIEIRERFREEGKFTELHEEINPEIRRRAEAQARGLVSSIRNEALDAESLGIWIRRFGAVRAQEIVRDFPARLLQFLEREHENLKRLKKLESVELTFVEGFSEKERLVDDRGEREPKVLVVRIPYSLARSGQANEVIEQELSKHFRRKRHGFWKFNW